VLYRVLRDLGWTQTIAARLDCACVRSQGNGLCEIRGTTTKAIPLPYTAAPHINISTIIGKVLLELLERISPHNG
jgi:hypothetical protein